MRHTKYRYNPATCRYEPVPLKAKDILLPVVIFLFIGSLSFVALLWLHSTWFTTEKEQALKQENDVLEGHYKKLTHELVTVKASIASLHKAEKDVQQKLVNDQTPESVLAALKPVQSANSKIALKDLLNKTTSKTSDLLHRAKSNNCYFGSSLAISSEDIVFLFNVPSIQPVENKLLANLASGYGMKTNPYHKGNYFHRGVDFIAPRGTPVVATASGKVIDVRKSNLPMGDGNVVEIDHGNGFKTRYAHLGDIRVKPGQQITKGTVIATIGVTGGSISPHLHYEVFKNNKRVDPINYIMEDVSSTDYKALVLLANQPNQSLD